MTPDKFKYINTCTLEEQGCRCFEKLSSEELALIDENSVDIHYKKGELICKQGSFADNIIFIEKGIAKIFLGYEEKKLVLKIVTNENLVGLTSIFEGNTIFQYSAQAYTACEARLINAKVFSGIMRRNLKFASEVFNILSLNAIQIYGRFFCLTRKQSYGRMADTLLCISDRVFKEEEFDLAMTRKELAELTDMATESVIRILKKFKDDDLISIDGKTFRILDYEGLQKISEHG